MSRKVRSRDNPGFRHLLRITTSARQRRTLGVSFIEGIHLCQSYLQRHGVPRQVVVTESAMAHDEVRQLLDHCEALAQAPAIVAPARQAADGQGAWADLPGGRFIELAQGLFTELSQLEHPVGIAFVIETPNQALPTVVVGDAVYLDGLQDPGNVGTILRTCAAVGVEQVFTAPTTAWCWSPKVLRAGMGAHFALSIHEAIAWDDLLARLRIGVAATAGDAPQTIWSSDLRAPCLWVFGAEGRGVDDTYRASSMRWLSIPQRAGVESLNVGSAAAVCLYEQARQRHADAQR